MDVQEGVNDIAEATAQYVNAQSKHEFAITVCPQVVTPPGGSGSVGAALDGSNNGVLDDGEIRQAVQYWTTGASVPGTNQTINDAKIRELIQMWILGKPVAATAAAVPLMRSVRLSAPNPLEREVYVQAKHRGGAWFFDGVIRRSQMHDQDHSF